MYFYIDASFTPATVTSGVIPKTTKVLPGDGLTRKQRRDAQKKERKQNKKSKNRLSLTRNYQEAPLNEWNVGSQGPTKDIWHYTVEQSEELMTLPRRNDYSLGQNYHLADNTFGLYQDEPFFPVTKLTSLRKIVLDKIRVDSHLDYFFQKFLHGVNEPKPSELTLTRNVISFETVDQIKFLRELMHDYIDIVQNFSLKIESCVCRVGSRLDSSSTLLLVLALSSNNSIEEILDAVDSCEIELRGINLLFLSGRLKRMNVAGVVFGGSCGNHLRLSTLWKWREASIIDWSELILQCNQHCVTCSSLLFLVGLRRNISSSFKIINLTFGRQKFFVSKLHGLSRAINGLQPSEEVGLKHPVLIKVWSLELYFAQQTVYSTNPDTLSLSFDQLERFGIRIQKVTFQVEVDSCGWGFLRINLTPSPIQVRFSNGVSIEWCPGSTKETRLVAIETYSIPQNVIDDVCTSKHEPRCFISPLLFIDQEFDVPFLKPVKVQMPFSVTESIGEHFDENFKLVVYSKHAIDDYQWTAIPDSSVKRFPNYFIYRSTTFSPVVSVSSGEESSMQATDFTTDYKPIYLTVCPLEEREKINFDCRRLNEEERLQIVKVKTNGIRVVTDMNKGHLVHGEISGNLEIDLRYGYKLNEDGRLVFKYPNPVHVANDQTYIMRLVDKYLYPEATITYYLRKGCAEEEEKLCQLNVQLQPNQSGGSLVTAQTYLDFETLGKILKVCNLRWSDLLQHFSICSTRISEIQDHNSEDVLLNLQSEF